MTTSNNSEIWSGFIDRLHRVAKAQDEIANIASITDFYLEESDKDPIGFQAQLDVYDVEDGFKDVIRIKNQIPCDVFLFSAYHWPKNTNLSCSFIPILKDFFKSIMDSSIHIDLINKAITDLTVFNRCDFGWIFTNVATKWDDGWKVNDVGFANKDIESARSLILKLARSFS